MNRLAVLLFVPAFASAGTMKVDWIPPTQYESGYAIEPGGLVSTTIQVGTCSAPGVFGLVKRTKIVPMPAATWTFVNLKKRVYCVRAAASTLLETSAWSNVAMKTVI